MHPRSLDSFDRPLAFVGLLLELSRSLGLLSPFPSIPFDRLLASLGLWELTLRPYSLSLGHWECTDPTIEF